MACLLYTSYGRGVEQDYQQAINWYQQAALAGHHIAKYNLGNCYYNGNGVEQDYQQAINWYQQAAEQNIEGAMNKLGECYQYGYGVEQDYQQAINWYQKAAEKGNGWAQDMFCLLYTSRCV